MDRLRDVYLKMIKLLSFVSFPVIFCLAFLAESIILIIYGNKWTEAVLPFQILSLFALGRSLSSPTSSLYSALGKPKIGFLFTLVVTPVFLISVWLASYYGVVSVSLATTSVRLTASVAALVIAINLLGISPGKFIQQLRYPAFLALTVVMLFFIIRMILPFKFSPVMELVTFLPLFIYFYFLLVRVFDSTSLNYFLDLLASQGRISILINISRKLLFC